MNDTSARIALLIDEGADTLRAAGIEGPQRDARMLLAFGFDVPPDVVYPPYSHPQICTAVDSDVAGIDRYRQAIVQRATGRPVSKIIGARDFWKYRFLVTDDVLDPRPETETLVASALEQPFTNLLDLGTGSGCILLSLLAERPQAAGMGVDISDAALAVAAQNAQRLDVAARVTLHRSDWFESVTGQFNLIVSNPPYIAAAEMPGLAADVRLHDPRIALTPGGDGLEAYRKIVAGAAPHLVPKGRLIVEIGPTQAQAVAQMMQDAGFGRITVLPDLDGRDRVVQGRIL
ncbi:MAG: peptide chain release factor N(5)-glutamine methyltransferase [Pseudomonadota bacterium]